MVGRWFDAVWDGDEKDGDGNPATSNLSGLAGLVKQHVDENVADEDVFPDPAMWTDVQSEAVQRDWFMQRAVRSVERDALALFLDLLFIPMLRSTLAIVSCTQASAHGGAHLYVSGMCRDVNSTTADPSQPPPCNASLLASMPGHEWRVCFSSSHWLLAVLSWLCCHVLCFGAMSFAVFNAGDRYLAVSSCGGAHIDLTPRH